jgi:hypothetical protein
VKKQGFNRNQGGFTANNGFSSSSNFRPPGFGFGNSGSGSSFRPPLPAGAPPFSSFDTPRTGNSPPKFTGPLIFDIKHSEKVDVQLHWTDEDGDDVLGWDKKFLKHYTKKSKKLCKR